MATPVINLLKRSSRLSPFLLSWEKKLRNLSLILLIGLIMSGVITGGIFIWLKVEETKLTARQDLLNRQIRLQGQKEGLFLLLKTRLKLVNQIKSSVKPWDKLLPEIELLAKPPVLRSVTNDEKQISISFQSGSLEEISGIVSGVLKLVADKVIASPQVISMSVDADGQIKLVLGIQPVL